MKKYQDGGNIPEEAQAIIDARKEEKAREKMQADERAENEAPKKAVKNMYDKVREMFGVKKPVTNKKGGKLAKGGKVSSASKRADGIATKGKTKGRFV